MLGLIVCLLGVESIDKALRHIKSFNKMADNCLIVKRLFSYDWNNTRQFMTKSFAVSLKKIVCNVPEICIISFMRSEIHRICHITRFYSFKKTGNKAFDSSFIADAAVSRRFWLCVYCRCNIRS
jgi:hypothetical protein